MALSIVHYARGWSPQVVDLCWLACDKPAHILHSEGKSICLCSYHVRELEEGSGKGYDRCPPPKGKENKGAWPWEDDPDRAIYLEWMR